MGGWEERCLGSRCQGLGVRMLLVFVALVEGGAVLGCEEGGEDRTTLGRKGLIGHGGV